MLKHVEIEKHDTFQITSKHSSFDSENHRWQESYFQVMAYQNTFNFAYDTSIHSTHDHEAYLWILLRPETDRSRILSWLEDLGYGDLRVDNVTVSEIDLYDLDTDFIAEA